MGVPGFSFAQRGEKCFTQATRSARSCLLKVFHCGTTVRDGTLVTDGGRVLAVTAVAPSVEQARARAYAAAEPIDWEGMQMRHDIAALVPGSAVAAGEGGR